MKTRTRDLDLPRCCYRRHGAIWHVRRGKWTRLGADLKEALAAYARIIETPTGGMSELLDAYLAYARPSLSESTRKSYETASRKVKKVFAEFRPDQVQQKDVARFKIALASTPNFANRCLSLLRSAFAWALEQQLVELNPAIGIKRHAEEKRKRLLTEAEVEAIRAKSNPRLQCVIDILVLTAQRVGDVLSIHRADIGAQNDSITFTQQKTDAKVSVQNPGLVPVIERAKTLHGNIRALTLFHTRKGDKPSYRTTKDAWDRACKAAGVEDATLHDLRAFSLTLAKAQGLDPTALAGHSSPGMTKRYLRSREIPVVSGPRIGLSNTNR